METACVRCLHISGLAARAVATAHALVLAQLRSEVKKVFLWTQDFLHRARTASLLKIVREYATNTPPSKNGIVVSFQLWISAVMDSLS